MGQVCERLVADDPRFDGRSLIDAALTAHDFGELTGVSVLLPADHFPVFKIPYMRNLGVDMLARALRDGRIPTLDQDGVSATNGAPFQ